MFSAKDNDYSAYYAASFAQAILVLIAAIFVAVVPETWLIMIAYPFESFSTWASRSALSDLLVPDYSSREFLDHYDRVFEAIEQWLPGVAWLYITPSTFSGQRALREC